MSNETKAGKVQANLAKKIDASITALAASEKITKQELGVVSRDTLEYLVLNSGTDIACVNRLLGVLTPMNQTVARLYFKAMLPWNYNDETEQFTDYMTGDKKIAKKRERVETFMKDEANNIWTWAADNVEIKPRTPFADRISALVKQSLTGIKEKDGREGLEPISPAEVLMACVAGGLSLSDMGNLLAAATANVVPEGSVPPVPMVNAAPDLGDAQVHGNA